MYNEKIWEQQEGEGQKLYSAFQIYLKNRNVEMTAKTLQKSASYIRTIAAKFDWKTRAAEFDKSLLEETRQELKRELAQFFKQQWLDCTELQKKAIDALRQKDLKNASFKSLNEIYHSAAQLQLKLADQLKLFDDEAVEDKNIEIRIVPASEPVFEGEMQNV